MSGVFGEELVVLVLFSAAAVIGSCEAQNLSSLLILLVINEQHRFPQYYLLLVMVSITFEQVIVRRIDKVKILWALKSRSRRPKEIAVLVGVLYLLIGGYSSNLTAHLHHHHSHFWGLLSLLVLLLTSGIRRRASL